MIGIIDYGSGNISAIKNIYEVLKIETVMVSKPEDLANVDKIILPGVGSFDQVMKSLNRSGIREELDNRVLKDRVPVLGICVGMQIMSKGSEEGKEKGLGWIDAQVKRFDDALIPHKPKTPHMGWNSLSPLADNMLLSGVEDDLGFYFVHSYYFSCHDETDAIAKTKYGLEFTCAVNKENVYGVQFHPEKSHTNGIKLFENFAKI